MLSESLHNRGLSLIMGLFLPNIGLFYATIIGNILVNNCTGRAFLNQHKHF